MAGPVQRLGSVGPRLITHMDLAGRNLVDFELPERLVLYDLRDDVLERLGLQRDQLVPTTAAHYPCTQEWPQSPSSSAPPSSSASTSGHAAALSGLGSPGHPSFEELGAGGAGA